MKRRENIFNPKRQIRPSEQWSDEQRQRFSAEASYGGNPEHKTQPGDYALTPPRNPRPGKTLCDAKRDILKKEALDLLKQGFQRGLVSVRERNGWPQNVWAVSDSEIEEVFEAQLENQAVGSYHGYPIPKDDDFRKAVREEWRSREPC